MNVSKAPEEPDEREKAKAILESADSERKSLEKLASEPIGWAHQPARITSRHTATEEKHALENAHSEQAKQRCENADGRTHQKHRHVNCSLASLFMNTPR